MADNRKYYYLKLKDNFFETDEMIVLESMPDGYLYSNILLKLYLRSLRNEGRIMFNERIPFNSTMLAQVTRHSVGDVEKAMRIFQELDLIEVLDNGAIYMTDIHNFIGQSSTEADRKRAFRARIKQEEDALLLADGQMSRQMSDECPDKSTPEIEIEIDIEKEIEEDTRVRAREESSSSSLLVNYFLDEYNKAFDSDLKSDDLSAQEKSVISELTEHKITRIINNVLSTPYLLERNTISWITSHALDIYKNKYKSYKDKGPPRARSGTIEGDDDELLAKYGGER